MSGRLYQLSYGPLDLDDYLGYLLWSMTNQEFIKLLKGLLRSCADTNSREMIRLLAIKRDDHLGWYDFEEVLHEEQFRRGRWYFNHDFTTMNLRIKENEPALLASLAWSLKTNLFDMVTSHSKWVTQGWTVPFTIEQQRRLKNLWSGDNDTHDELPPLIRLRRELLEAGLKHHFWLFSYDSIDSVAFFSEGDAVIARCMIDDFEWNPDKDPW